MVDGRVDLQGEVATLRDQGVFDDIAKFEEVKAHKEEQAVEADKENPNAGIDAEAGDNKAGTVKEKKKPRKLVEQEHRELGSVKWSIYSTYLKAS